LKREGRAIVVEGYMDVVSLAQYGIDYAVATLGTATTRDHLERLFRYVPEVVFCFDGDRAGRAAAWRALENALPVLHEGRSVTFLFLPEGEDPDTLVRKEGKEAFAARLNAALSLPDYFFQALSEQVDLARSDAPARIAELAKPLLANLKSEALRHLMLERLTEKNRLAGASLAKMMPGTGGRGGTTRFTGPKPGESGVSPIRRLVQLLLQYPALAGREDMENTDFLTTLDRAGIGLLTQLLSLLREAPGITFGSIIEHFRGSEHEQHLAKLAAMPVPGEPEDHVQLYADTLRSLRLETLSQEIERLMNKDRFQGLAASEKAELKRLLTEKSSMKTVQSG